MTPHDGVERRVYDLRAKLEIIERAIAEELAKVYKRRNYDLLRFLYLEREAYLLAVTHLEDVGPGEGGATTGKRFPIYDPQRVVDYAGAEVKRPGKAGARRVHRIVTWGGIGDALLMTPAIRIFKQRDPACKVHVYCTWKEHREVLKNNPYIDRLVFIGTRGRAILKIISDRKLAAFRWANYGMLGPNLFYNNHAAEIMGEKLGTDIDSHQLDCFITEGEECEARKTLARYRNPVVIQVNAKSSPNKHWPIENWERLVLGNPQYDFLQVGLADEQPVRGATDLRGKLTLRQALSVVKVAKVFIGVESCLAHAAAAFKTPAVVLFGASTPVVFGHANNKNLYNAPRCSPCMDTLGKAPCPYGAPCMSNITVPEVERALHLLAGAGGRGAALTASA